MANDESASAQIDAILAGLPDDQRGALQSLRETIAAAAPEAVEAISYALPAFRYRGRPLVSFGAAKGHVAFYVMSPAAMEAHRERVSGETRVQRANRRDTRSMVTCTTANSTVNTEYTQRSRPVTQRTSPWRYGASPMPERAVTSLAAS